MVEIIERSVLLTFDELRMLLYVCGFRRLEGVYMPEKEFTAQEVIEVLHHLSLKGHITAKEAMFEIQEELRAMLEIMGAPTSTFVQETADGRAYFCYVSPGRVVVSEKDQKKKDAVRLCAFYPEEFERWREELKYDYDRSGSADVGQPL